MNSPSEVKTRTFFFKDLFFFFFAFRDLLNSTNISMLQIAFLFFFSSKKSLFKAKYILEEREVWATSERRHTNCVLDSS